MMRCKACFGSGEIMGSGMIMIDCPKCNSVPIKSNKPVLDKRSKSYKVALKELHALHPKKSKDEIAAIFDEEFNKIED